MNEKSDSGQFDQFSWSRETGHSGIWVDVRWVVELVIREYCRDEKFRQLFDERVRATQESGDNHSPTSVEKE